MKKITILLFTLFLGYHAHSQILITLLLGDKLNSDELEFGLEGGLNYTSLNGNGLETNKYLGNLNLGFYFDIKLKGQWNIYTGCLVKANMGVARLTDNDLNKLGATIHDFEVDGIPVEGNYSQEMRYFLVPIFIKYRFKNRFYLEAGPQLGLMYRGWVEFNSTIDGSDATIKEYNTDMINSLDAGLAGGFGYKLMNGAGWTIGVKYYYGFFDVYREIDGTRNHGFFGKLQIPIGAGKAKKKQAEAQQQNQ